MSATLGGYIKDLRLQKNISQLEIAFALGWKEPSRLSRIEQGKVGNPPRELIDKLIDAMHLTEEEKNQLLAVGNYLPTKEEIDGARKKIRQVVDNWPYPATCIDYTWRIIYTNREMFQIHETTKRQQEYIGKTLPRVIELAFDTNLPINKPQTPEVDEKRKIFLLRTLKHFQHALKDKTHEKWYRDLIRRMMANKLFRDLWIESQTTVFENDIMNFSSQTFVKEESKSIKYLNFYFFLVPVFG